MLKNWSEGSFKHSQMIDWSEDLVAQGWQVFVTERRKVFNPILQRNEFKNLQRADFTGDGIVSVDELLYWFDLHNKNDPKAWNQDGLEITQENTQREADFS